MFNGNCDMCKSSIIAKWFLVGTIIIFFSGGCALWESWFGSEEEEELPIEETNDIKEIDNPDEAE